MKRAGAGRPERSTRGIQNSQCSRQPCPFAFSGAGPCRTASLSPQTCFPAWTPRALLRGRTLGRSAGRAPSQTLEVQGWGQRLPAPRSTPPACGQPGFPAAVSALRSPRLSLGPVLRARGADGPRLSGCTGPGAASTGQRPPAFPRQTQAPPVRTSAPTGRARALTAGSPRRGPGRPARAVEENWVSARRARSATPRERGEATAWHGPAQAASRAASAPRDAVGSWCSDLCPGRLRAVLLMPTPPTVTHRPPPPQQQGRKIPLSPVGTFPTDTLPGSLHKTTGVPRQKEASRSTPVCC